MMTSFLIASDLSASGWRAGAGVAIAALGFPLYFLMRRMRFGGDA